MQYANERTIESLIETVESLQRMLVSIVTSGDVDTSNYAKFRRNLMRSNVKEFVPEVIEMSRDAEQALAHCKNIASGNGSWQKRRQYVYDSFKPLFERLEANSVYPADTLISDTITNFDPTHINAYWHKALDRRADDPEGAITLARSLLESVCKYILDQAGETYFNNDLPKLYKQTSEVLNLAPSQHSEKSFKAILGGCNSVVLGLGSLRNQIGDAHGQGGKPVKPATRHAVLAVNLAGTMASFLVDTWNYRNTP